MPHSPPPPLPHPGVFLQWILQIWELLSPMRGGKWELWQNLFTTAHRWWLKPSFFSFMTTIMHYNHLIIQQYQSHDVLPFAFQACVWFFFVSISNNSESNFKPVESFPLPTASDTEPVRSAGSTLEAAGALTSNTWQTALKHVIYSEALGCEGVRTHDEAWTWTPPPLFLTQVWLVRPPHDLHTWPGMLLRTGSVLNFPNIIEAWLHFYDSYYHYMAFKVLRWMSFFLKVFHFQPRLRFLDDLLLRFGQTPPWKETNTHHQHPVWAGSGNHAAKCLSHRKLPRKLQTVLLLFFSSEAGN